MCTYCSTDVAWAWTCNKNECQEPSVLYLTSIRLTSCGVYAISSIDYITGIQGT